MTYGRWRCARSSGQEQPGNSRRKTASGRGGRAWGGYADTVTDSAADTSTAGPTKATTPRARWLDAALLIALLPVTAAAVRIVLYSGGDPTLMRVLIETLDVTTLLLGTLLPMFPLALWLVFQPLITDLPLTRKLVTQKHPTRSWWLALIIALPLLYVLIGPWPNALRTIGWVAVGLLLGALTLWTVGVLRTRASGGTWRDSLRVRLTVGTTPLGGRGHLLIAPLVLVAVILVTPRGFWLPLESITTENSQVAGYVLQTENDWTTVMTEERAIFRYPADSITARFVCDQGEYTSLITVIAGGTPPPTSACD